MATQEDQLRQILSQSLSPDKPTRQNAERALVSAQSAPGHALAVLRVVSSAQGGDAGGAADLAIRQAAAVHFKNMVKGGWAPDDDDDGGGRGGVRYVIPESDRALIRDNLVSLMCTVPPQLQSQCSESIAIIASSDFPSRWDNLLSDLVSKFGDPDWCVVNGVLLTANSILKRFRHVQRSDALYADILYVLQRLQEPLTRLFVGITSRLGGPEEAGDVAGLAARLSALRSINRIFYSLNYQDLPEFFEDHMGEWMAGFAKLLQYTNPILVDEDEEMQPGEIRRLVPLPLCFIRLFLVSWGNLLRDAFCDPFEPRCDLARF
jgi:exportin-2 (importin alpha re-exporter)